MHVLNRSIALVVLATLSLFPVLVGCSTWRCRGFVDAMEKPGGPPRGNYVIDSIEFRHLAQGDNGWKERSPMLTLLSRSDGLVGTSYIEDLAKATGLTNDAPNAIKVLVSIVPIDETQDGKKTIAWPLCGTLGVFPAHFVTEMPFDIIVRFDKTPDGRPDLPAHSFATARVGLVRTDRQFGLTRMDMDAPPEAQSAVGEIRDDGTVGTGSELRSERFRRVFVETVSSAILHAISVRERGEWIKIPQSATEFGAVAFPVPNSAERERTPGWGTDPQDESIPEATTFEDFCKEAWNHPKTEEEIRLKQMVLVGLLSKEKWKGQMQLLWDGRKKQ